VVGVEEEFIRVAAASRVGGREALVEVGASVETLCFSRRSGMPRLVEDWGARLTGEPASGMEMELCEGLRLWLGSG